MLFSHYQKFEQVNKFKLKLISHKGYDEYIGKLLLKYSKQNISFETKKIKNNFEMLFHNNRENDKFRIIVKNDFNFYFYYNSNLITVTKFPLASFFSHKIYKRNSLVPSFSEILKDNLNLINIFEKFTKKKILIR